MGRTLRSRIPVRPEVLCPEWSYLKRFREADAHIKKRQKKTLTDDIVLEICRRCIVLNLPPLQITDTKVSAPAAGPRSYIVEGEGSRSGGTAADVPAEPPRYFCGSL